MMPHGFYLAAAGSCAADAALSTWRPAKPHLLRSALALVIAYVPMALLPELSALGITLLAAAVAMLGLFSYARMVGLSGDARYFALTFLCAAAFFVAARVHWYGLFQAMPVFAMFLIAAAGTVGATPHGYLQKVCLSWLGALVYGHLMAHAAMFTDLDLGKLAPAGPWIAAILLCAKIADVAWDAARHSKLVGVEQQIPVCAAGGTLGGVVLHALWASPLTLAEMALFGLIVGAAIGAASRSYKLIVADVVGTEPGRAMKGTMVFGFAFALALGFHFIWHLA